MARKTFGSLTTQTAPTAPSQPAGYLYPTDGTMDYASWLRRFLSQNAGPTPVAPADGINRTRPDGPGPSANAYAHANPNAAFLRALNPGYVKPHGQMPKGKNPFLDAVIAEDEQRHGKGNAFAGPRGRR
jgi:hypothetical protein